MSKYIKVSALSFWVCVLILILVSSSLYQDSEDNHVTKPVVEEDLIRFHVVAHSDAPMDQKTKNRLKDFLLHEHLLPLLRNIESKEEALLLLGEHLTLLEEGAQKFLLKEGVSRPLKAELGRFSFPTRRYGERIYPAGMYTALQVVIGEGRGENWWCVIFPPYCLPLAAVNDPSAEEDNLGEAGGPKELPEKPSYTDSDPFTQPRPRCKLMDWLRAFFSR